MYPGLEQFPSLELYRDRLTKVIRFPDLIYDVSGDLLTHADTLGRASEIISVPEAPERNEARRLKKMAAGRRRKRISFFNSDSDRMLRKMTYSHWPKVEMK